MARLTLKIQSLKRAPEVVRDDSVVSTLVGRVQSALDKGEAPVAAVVVRPDRFDFVGLGPVRDAKLDLHRFIASLTTVRSTVDDTGVEAIAVVGVLRRTTGPGQQVPVAAVFVEWPDNRWTMWQALVDADGHVLDETDVWMRAVDGDALPNNLGRWWSLARRANLSATMERQEPEPVH